MYFADVAGRAAMQDASLETLITRMERMRRNHPTLTFDKWDVERAWYGPGYRVNLIQRIIAVGLAK